MANDDHNETLSFAWTCTFTAEDKASGFYAVGTAVLGARRHPDAPNNISEFAVFVLSGGSSVVSKEDIQIPFGEIYRCSDPSGAIASYTKKISRHLENRLRAANPNSKSWKVTLTDWKS